MKGFDRTSEGFWMIKPEFREPVTFLKQDIRQALPEETFHLILCRYLAFTYFEGPLQSKTLRDVIARMHVGGAIVLGKNERLPDGDAGLIPWSEKEGVYRRAPAALMVP